MASGTGIGEFFVSLTVDAASGALTVGNLVQEFGALEVATVAEIGLLWELAVQLARVTDEGLKASLGFAQFTMHTGLSAQELQRWQIVAEQAHGSAADVAGTVENLTKHLANLAIGIPDSSLGSLQQLGISAFGAGGKLKDAFQILGEVRQRLGVITQDAGQQERILSGLGISPNLRETLLLGQSQFDALAATAHGMTAAQQGSFDEMRQGFVRIHLVAQDIGRDIGAWVADLDRATGSLKAVETIFRGIRSAVEGKTEALKVPEDQHRGLGGGRAFEDSLMYKLFFEPHPEAPQSPLEKLLGLREPAAPAAAGAGTTVHIDKHDNYVISSPANPKTIEDIIEKSWDDLMVRKTVDGFDRQTNNGGY